MGQKHATTIRYGSGLKDALLKIFKKERKKYSGLTEADVIRMTLEYGVKEYNKLNPGVVDTTTLEDE